MLKLFTVCALLGSAAALLALRSGRPPAFRAGVSSLAAFFGLGGLPVSWLKLPPALQVVFAPLAGLSGAGDRRGG